MLVNKLVLSQSKTTMGEKSKKIRLGWLVVIAVAIVVNVIGYYFYRRVDLTEDRRFTLSPYTKQILDSLGGQIKVVIYLDGRGLPIEFKRFRLAVRELLDEMKVYKGKTFQYEFVNPTDEKLSEKQRQKLYKDLANLGLMPLQYEEMSQGEAKKILIFPDAKIVYSYRQGDSVVSRETGVTLLNKDPNFQPTSQENINNSIQSLEYKFVNEFVKLLPHKTKTVAFIEGHGELPEVFVVDFERALANYYNVQRGRIGGKYGILDGFDAVVIAKPTKKFSKADKFVLDQYLMKGGRILWLVDGVNVDMDSILVYDKAFAFPAFTQELGIDDMLFKYGVRVNSDLLQDLYSSRIRLVAQGHEGREQYQSFQWLYFPILVSQNNHVINKYIDFIHTVFISSIDTVGKRPGLRRTVLLTTSPYTRIIKINFPYEILLSEVNLEPNKVLFNHSHVPVAVLVEGHFNSLFVGRIVRDLLPPGTHLIKRSKPAKMIVVADGDMARNEVTSDGRVMPLGFDRYSGMTFPGNKEFLVNAVNYLCGDEGLMKLRGRQFKLRVLDQKKVTAHYTMWQALGLGLPLVLVFLLFLAFRWWRKRV